MGTYTTVDEVIHREYGSNEGKADQDILPSTMMSVS